MPNGLEQLTATNKPTDIRRLDFTRLTDKKIKNAAKAWLWGETKAGFSVRCNYLSFIIDFFEYRDNLRRGGFDKFIQARTVEKLNIENSVLVEEIIMYISECNMKKTKRSVDSYITSLRLFLTYMNEVGIYNTEPACFDYLTVRGRGQLSTKEILPMPKEDFDKLIKNMKEKSQHNTLHMLYYIITYLIRYTPLRINSVLDLDCFCISEKSKGIFAVNVKVKTSDGDKKDIQVSREIKRLIEVAVSLTADIRKNAPIELKDYLFLTRNEKGSFRVISIGNYTKYFKKCCEEVGIKLYGASNIRKLYFTTLYENAIKNNVSLLNLKALTDHASIDTTENYYVKENIRNYLEATMGIEIGNIPLAGEVVDTYPEATRENLVNERCGYCRNPECKVLGTVDCLMCDGFITTPKHISDFEEAISVLNKQLSENENQHDKEHLYAVKRLYASYLEQLYIRKECIINDANN